MGERPCEARGTRCVSLTSSSPAIWAALGTAPSTPVQAPVTSARTRRAPGGARFFTPAVQKVAQRPRVFPILGATPTRCARGGISLRLRLPAEDPQTVASECGTSVKMLSDHYGVAIEDLRRHEPPPVDVEWRDARSAQQITIRANKKPYSPRQSTIGCTLDRRSSPGSLPTGELLGRHSNHPQTIRATVPR